MLPDMLLWFIGVSMLICCFLMCGKNLGKSEFDEMPLNAVKTHQGRLLRIALGKCSYLIIRLVAY